MLGHLGQSASCICPPVSGLTGVWDRQWQRPAFSNIGIPLLGHPLSRAQSLHAEALLGLAERIPSPPGPGSRSLSPTTTAALFPLHYTPSPPPPTHHLHYTTSTTIPACYPAYHTLSNLRQLFYSLPLAFVLVSYSSALGPARTLGLDAR